MIEKNDFLPIGAEILSANDLARLAQEQSINAIHGAMLGEQIKRLIFRQEIPENVAPLKQFLTGRSDYTSQICLSYLKEH